MTHTPGPWTINHNTIVAPDANAALIAAAPDMLEILKIIRHIIEGGQTPGLHWINQVIDKADGKP